MSHTRRMSALPDARHTDWRMPRTLRRATRAVVEALFADESGPPPEERIDWTVEDVEDFLARSGPRARTIFRASMLALTALAPLTIGRPLPLVALDYRARAEAIERFERTPLGLAVLGAKAMLCIVYYEHPDSAAEIGFDGRCKEAK